MISYKNVILRPMQESDLSDIERWFTVETEWGQWDAPWEEDDPEGQLVWRREHIQKSADNPPGFYRCLEIDTDERRHIGWVSCYLIDGVDDVIAVGINIPPIDARRKGYGRNAMLLFMAYIFSQKDVKELYTQTWSGNYPMIKMAENIGFVEIGRITGIRRWKGERYDALTFSMSKSDFFGRYKDIKL